MSKVSLILVNFYKLSLTKLGHFFPADDFVHGIERSALSNFKLLNEQGFFHVINADNLRVTTCQDARPVSGVAQGNKKAFAFLKVNNFVTLS